MKLFPVLSLLLCLPAAPAIAQSISGQVTEPSGKPLDGASVTLLQGADSAWLRTELATADGRYTLNSGVGSFVVQVSAPGFATASRPLRVDTTGAVADFRLLLQTAALGGVTVTSKKPFIEARPGMMVVNIEGSAASAGSTALELLQRSPGVQVAANGAVSMRGKSGVQVYIDGRPSRLSGDQLTAYLRSMTAEEIAQLELITQPGSRYDAAGTAGIINIRTRVIRKRGVNGNLGGSLVQATYPFGNLSGRITYRHDRLTLYASEYFNYVKNHNFLEVNRKYLKPGTGEQTGNVLTSQDMVYTSRFHRIKTGGEYAIDKATTLGLRAQLPLGNPEVDYSNRSVISDLPMATTAYNAGRRSMRNHWNEKEIGLLAQHRFGDESNLSFDGYYIANQSEDHGLFVNEPTDAAGQPAGAPDLWEMSFPLHIRLLSLQSDYSRNIGKKIKLETGLKYSKASIETEARFRIPDAGGTLVPDTMRSSRFRYDEGIAAAYANATRSFGDRLELQAGLRAEHTLGDGYVISTGERFHRDYLSLFPTLFASWKADSLNNLTFSYGRRLDRPDYYQLNPARDYIDKYSYRVGNPKLLPQFINNFELGYSYRGELTATLSFMQADGIISDFFVQDDQTKTAYEIHDNIPGYRQGGLSVNYNKQLWPWWTTNLYGDVYFRTFTGNYFGLDYQRPGSSYSFNVNNQFQLGHRWMAELSGWYNGPALNTVFTQSAPFGSVDVAVSKKLLSDSLVIKLAVSDVFGTQRYRGSNRFANFDTDVYSTWDARRAAVSVNYSFGRSIDLMQRRSDAEKRSM